MNRKNFIESVGATCDNWTWSWSFVNHTERFVIFGLWDRFHEHDAGLIIEDSWQDGPKGKKQAAFGQAMRHIQLVQEGGYGLRIFRIYEADDTAAEGYQGAARISHFDEELENRELLKIGSKYYALRPFSENSKISESINAEEFLEGAVTRISINAFERNGEARQQCLQHFGFSCAVCDFNFEKQYGSVGKDYIHVHHVVPLSTIRREYKIDPIRDLVPICPNCHAMIHRVRPSLTVEDLRKLFRSKT